MADEKTSRTPGDVVAVKQVDETGTISGLDEHKGKEFLLVRVPGRVKDKMAGATEKPKAIVEDLINAARAHKDLSQKQASKLKEKYAKDVSADEFKNRLKKLNDEANKRVGDFAKEVETRYERLEKELEARMERLLRAGKPAGEANTDTHTISLEEADDGGDAEGRGGGGQPGRGNAEGADLPDRDAAK